MEVVEHMKVYYLEITLTLVALPSHFHSFDALSYSLIF